ncbi:MAG TPA: histidine phosphatase family protein [Candidatus Baltobacteraceae bacterium]|jgi:broad specificity phosphatase PhoE|nr:histidine phosphatase family protein [Candidatus Baltobacteraceae bacterium]
MVRGGTYALTITETLSAVGWWMDLSEPNKTNMRELVVVRHGRTAWNAEGRFQGQTDVPLDEVGLAQARMLAVGLAEEPFDFAVSSDLQRAVETARIALGGRSLELHQDARWREGYFGSWEGRRWEDLVVEQPDRAFSHDPFIRFSPDGETFDQICERVRSAYEEIREGEARSVLVVTHGGALHAMLRVALGAPAAEAMNIRFASGSLTRFRITKRGARLLDLNRTFD